ncbi:MAG: DUF2585 family protein [Deltaproteobacteria bacterium]|nr:DUF2585 family protein [Deltaproteobacteria bacterium]
MTERHISLWIYIAAVAAIIAITASGLLAMGRTAFCRCGTIQLWSGNIWSNENSQQIADPYTFTHVLHGAGTYGILHMVARSLPLGMRGVLAVGAEAAFEVFENTDAVINRYRETTISLNYYGDSVINSIGDILAFALGFVLASRLPTRVTVVGFILIELALILSIRDSLFLNMLMLIYPISTVRLWQFGG